MAGADGTMLDEVDLALIDAVQANPRAAWSELGPVLGAAPMTLSRRWRRLTDAGRAWWRGRRHRTGRGRPAVLAAHDTAVMIVNHAMAEADVEAVLRHPRSAVASDGWVLEAPGDGHPHPRNFGTFARVLRRAAPSPG
ncbi:hypothetical protein BJF79_20545 [Actinomadura sp. CNU-125]|uniref:AsnC family transcriptional regulator n=1 Tax=Actinomadura sp. CNU-125 TaxID=1904961 RepID=UPI0009637532|nr:AsnC family transcriptional regulator [Actinomadura sp. CNU-125]OLT13440.1 hypothetical protein BJF79_20545 [Actinomadura sp. CNU-125]